MRREPSATQAAGAARAAAGAGEGQVQEPADGLPVGDLDPPGGRLEQLDPSPSDDRPIRSWPRDE